MTFIEDFEDNVSKNFVYVWVGGDGEFISWREMVNLLVEESTVYVDTHSSMLVLPKPME